MSPNWINKFRNLATHVAMWSKDPSTKVGAIIVRPDTHRVVGIGYNGFGRGVDDTQSERFQRPAKYLWTSHAEMSAITNAASEGASTQDTVMFVTLAPCPQCAVSIINAGITAVYCPRIDFHHSTYGESFKVTVQMFVEAGVDLYEYAD